MAKNANRLSAAAWLTNRKPGGNMVLIMGGSRPLRARLSLAGRDPGLAERMATELKELGFTVVHVAQWGVGFEGSVELFERIFQSRPEKTKRGHRFGPPPVLPDAITQAGGAVYFPTKPEFAQD